ncbi:alpha/beta hydrolase [Streptomyces sp. B1866]|uniref:alpha/beta hydrolase n=1 Tax=Streptomyces sp. B1866 TaxID=3075431 RepID=UPI00288D1F64|nr:alpha/beta hydrolase [Streptomyces sp. B1866]MDT3399590.1 alpha/beta hydrolase [Streptomyces sp. B1866]
MVLVLLATTGWAAQRRAAPDPLTAALKEWRAGTLAGRPLPAPDAPPHVLARFFGSLTAVERDRLVRRYPLAVGNLGGAPVSLRYRANRVALAQAREVQRRRMGDRRLTALGRREAGRRMHRYESMLRPGRQILAFDPSGAGRAAEVFGGLERARRVTVVVPGVDTGILNFERTNGARTAPSGMARALYEAELAADPGGRDAVVAWADYTAPDGIGVDAASARLAARGAPRLRALALSLPGDSRLTLVCHSYGSVVCGLAARRLPARVTDIVVAGSPGVRADRAADLGTRARVWATRDAGDWIEDVPHLEVGGFGHGADPVSPGFGARVLSAAGARGHGGYFEPGTASLRNFAAIGVGAAGWVTCADGADCTVGLRRGGRPARACPGPGGTAPYGV